MTLALRYAVRSDVGLLREGNEDSAYAGPRLLAVADGMGGHAAGEVASAVTIGAMAELDASLAADPVVADDDMMTDLSHAVGAANMRLQQMIMANPAVEGMGTTLTAVLWHDGHVAVCHIGDSRGYLLRDGELYQITHDHTLVQSLVDEGRITEDDVSTHPQRSLLLRALDGRTLAEPDLSVHESQLGDRYLLCSDGLSGVVSDETLRDVLADIPDLDAVARQLIDLAIRGGGPDNITCIVADVVDNSTTRPSMAPILAGAAANGTDPRSQQVPGTGPFATASRTATAPQPMLTDGDEPIQNGALTPSPNGAATKDRRRHRAARRKRWPIVTTSLVVLIAVIVVGGYIGYRYTQDQYYVATDTNGEVIIYQGVNQSVIGINLSHPHTRTGIMLGQVSDQYRQELANTPSASSLAGAQRIVSNIANQVNTCRNWYDSLKNWETAESAYTKALSTARQKHKPPTGIQSPGPQPARPANVDCPSPTAYGVLPSQIPAGL